ncbi:hypothetical protein MAPG_04228 [Magnaporthiopsis poae ATCC 64411]|uniref:Uncharacterized protein n=1 Tax=Magnaporthiopsis poae (strain ATCC 64411 / 73-15) TaxID=644358 RepID=A0A0C4DW54_MAGP6|nr:hypothetical protein MAPG_04228 [Magnaporthiopsis poae ATCC 64411]
MSPPRASPSGFVDVELSPPRGRDRDLEGQREAPAARGAWRCWGRLGRGRTVYNTRARGGGADAQWIQRAETRMCYAFVIVVAAVAVGWLIFSVVQRERVLGGHPHDSLTP